MTNMFKALGLLTTAAIAVGLGVASVGSASGEEEFTATEYPATLHAKPSAHSFTLSGGPKIECASVTITGQLEEPSKEVELKPEYNECTASLFGGEKQSTTTVSCGGELSHYNFLFFFTVTNCTKEYTHHIMVYNDPEHTELLCEYELAENEGEKVTHKNLEETGDVEVTWEIGGIEYTRVAGSFFTCGSESGEATYEGTSVVSAKNESGEDISFHVG